ncbi:MAG: hypothetical protein M0P14_05010 [Alkaliphilus sp.]|nr:hypothetical protein [Alkaliphilus sp.]
MGFSMGNDLKLFMIVAYIIGGVLIFGGSYVYIKWMKNTKKKEMDYLAKKMAEEQRKTNTP